MDAPFDIAADLDTPVSAYLKLQPFRPRFLLESVERGERLARYSFLGLGDAVQLTIEPDRVLINGRTEAAPSDAQQWLGLMRRALDMAPELSPEIDDIPFAGGLVGASLTHSLPVKWVRLALVILMIAACMKLLGVV